MDLRNSNLRKTFFQYLIASFGGALISSIYSIVDLAMVGKYQGAEGTAAIALISPFWNVIYSLGLLVGIGGAVPFSTLRGKSEKSKSNEYFTASVIAGIVLALITWVVMIFFDRQLLMVFGANETLMPLARAYIYPIKFAVPLFIFNQMLSAFVRNDGDPSLATKGVMFGGIFNVFGDYFFVFTMDMGIMGAGLATAIGQFFTFLIIITHFRSKLNTLIRNHLCVLQLRISRKDHTSSSQ
ncbi:MAG: MATE family efflux transporter [Lachnospiraceae bacterium]|jgi:Na+-driven multidrug efflux pump|nr:MATE family efflux transporter [Lachnospiraceae bacterium]